MGYNECDALPGRGRACPTLNYTGNDISRQGRRLHLCSPYNNVKWIYPYADSDHTSFYRLCGGLHPSARPRPTPQTRLRRWLRRGGRHGACLAVGTWISALTENQILAYLATFGALLVAYLMNGIQTMFTTGNLLAFIVFMVVLLVASVLVGVICKRLAAGAVVFCAGAVVLFVLFQLRPAWLLKAFNAVLSALALFEPFKDIVGGMFSISAIVYYLSVMGLFLFLTGQALARRRWN